MQNGAFATTVAARERLDVNLTSAFIELGLTTARIWGSEGERVLKKARGGDAPYRIVNRTGATVDVWSDTDDKARGADVQRARIADGGDNEWRFDDWKTTREVRPHIEVHSYRKFIPVVFSAFLQVAPIASLFNFRVNLGKPFGVSPLTRKEIISTLYARRHRALPIDC